MARVRGQVFVSWRLLRSNPEDFAFNVYRSDVLTGKTEKINTEPVAKPTINRGKLKFTQFLNL